MQVVAVNRPDVPPISMPARFRTDVSYFMTPRDEPDVPKLGADEYWIRLSEAKIWLDELVVSIVSPLSAEVKAEVELTEDQEAWLEWIVANDVQHIRLVADK